MKNLATCTPHEFVKQTNLIKHSVEKWLKETEILKIRKTLPELIPITLDMDEKDVKKAAKENDERRRAQVYANASKMFDAAMADHPDETVELLALLCFVEPEDVDNHTMDEYLSCISDMILCESVVGFFTSLKKSGLMNILG